MSPLVLTLLVALAGWRIVRFWLEDGLIANQRIWVQNKILGIKPGVVRTKLHYLTGCPWCLEFWVSGIVVALAWHWTPIPLPGLVWLAAWGLCPVFRRYADTNVPVDLVVTNTVKHRESKFEQ